MTQDSPVRDELQSRRSLVERDKRYVWHPYTPMQQYIASGDPLVIGRAEGSRLLDMDGRSILDGNSSWWTSLLGHNHPRLVQALKAQADRLCHTSLAGVTHAPAVEFAEALVERAPEGLKHVFFSDNGSTAVEAALKQALQYWQQTGRPEKRGFLSLEHAFHGETMGVIGLSGVDAFSAPFRGMGGARRLPTPAEDPGLALRVLEQTLEQHASKVAALVLEPRIQGAGGMLMYDAEYLRRARRLTEEFDVLLIVDEVFTGYGRTGPFWACDSAAICPDILCSAKGLSGGLLPFAATISTDRVFEAFLGDPSRAFYYGHTYCGNPLGAAVALEVLAVYQDEDILEQAAVSARRLAGAFEELGALPGVERVRSLGMCAALELATDRPGYLDRSGWLVFDEALRRGAYIRPLGNVVYLCPPLNITAADLSELLDILSESVRSVLERNA